MTFRVALACAAVLAADPATHDPPHRRDDFAAAFAEVHATVEKQFFDPALRGLDWNQIGQEYGERAKRAGTLNEFSRVVNEMLALLKTSHTHFYTSRDPAYYQLRSIFDGEEFAYPGVGMFTQEIDGRTFISGVLDGAPAALAGLRAGDRIVAVNNEPFHPIGSFENCVGLPTRVTVQRSRDPTDISEIPIVPAMLEPRALFETAIRNSVRILDRPPIRVGYIRMWTYAGLQYREALKDKISNPPLRDADALIIDLRDGWGGANPDDVNLFNKQAPALSYISRNGTEHGMDPSWRKPVALLVNEGTRSGKEIIAYSFKKHRIGPVVGQRTAGAVVGGRPFTIGPEMLLYLATADVRVDGERLEGVGVTPDIKAPFDLPYANGADPQLEAAIDALSP